jgi:hypothetical protein|tara:strand:+ start:64 stop:300 length:237 start_codon:yes stop_codon:yes gene_type:complete
MKKLILVAIVISAGWYTLVKADTESVTPSEFIGTVASVPGKVVDHFQSEVAKTKEYQAQSWAEIKFKLQGLKEKFTSN